MKTWYVRLALACTALASGLALAGDIRLVLQGHDPVAYFTDGKPVKGDPRFAYDFDEARYHFASAQHRDMFAADPEKYAPQFGGYCTGSMSRNVRNEGVPETHRMRRDSASQGTRVREDGACVGPGSKWNSPIKKGRRRATHIRA